MLKSLYFQMLKLIQFLIRDLVHPNHIDLHSLLRTGKSKDICLAIGVTIYCIYVTIYLLFSDSFTSSLSCSPTFFHLPPPIIHFVPLFQQLIFSIYDVHRLVLGGCWGYDSEQERHEFSTYRAFSLVGR